VKDLKAAAVPAVRDLAVAGAGYVLANYGGSTFLGNTSPLTQGIVQGAGGFLGMVVARRARTPILETAAFGAGLSGMVKVLYALLASAARTQPGGAAT